MRHKDYKGRTKLVGTMFSPEEYRRLVFLADINRLSLSAYLRSVIMHNTPIQDDRFFEETVIRYEPAAK